MIQTIRVALWSILAGVLAGMSVLGWYYSDSQKLALAKQYLLEKNFEGASRIFESLGNSPWYGSDAQTGRVLTSVLGRKGEQIDLPEAMEGFPCRLLLFQALMEGRYRACAELARLLNRHEAWAPIFEGCARLELGDGAEEPVVPHHIRNVWLGQRLQQTRRWLKSDPQNLVYDRRGTILGVTREGVLEWDEDIDEGLLPPLVSGHLKRLGDGKGYRLSIDLELCRIALAAMEGYRGSIVILSVETGDVLAAVSDRKTLEKEGKAAFQQLREPASISKLITVTAAMRAGLDADELISQMSCQGAERYKGGILYCSYRAGPLEGLNHAMAISCNIAFANLGVLVGRKGILDELNRYCFDRESSDGFVYGQILERDGPELQLADLSIGLAATSITPLHAALVAAVFGNQGFMPEPRLISAEDGWLGLSPVALAARKGKAVIDVSWIPMLLASMEAVTERGTAHGISPAQFQVAMKTGTGRNTNMAFHTNYIGVGPMPNPKVSFCVRITNQPTSTRVRRATIRVARRLFDELSRKPYLLP